MLAVAQKEIVPSTLRAPLPSAVLPGATAPPLFPQEDDSEDRNSSIDDSKSIDELNRKLLASLQLDGAPGNCVPAPYFVDDQPSCPSSRI